MEALYSMVRFFVAGGPFMYPILIVFAVGVAIAIERYITLTQVSRQNEGMWSKLQPALADGDFDAAREMTSADDSTVSRLLGMGLARQGAAMHTKAAGGFAQLQASVGETEATHTPSGGSPVTVSGVWVPASTIRERNPDGELGVARGTYHLPAGTADVTSDSKFEIAGTTYAVDELHPDGAEIALELVSYDRRRLGGAETRSRR